MIKKTKSGLLHVWERWRIHDKYYQVKDLFLLEACYLISLLFHTENAKNVVGSWETGPNDCDDVPWGMLTSSSL
jgi:hypothetical protein